MKPLFFSKLIRGTLFFCFFLVILATIIFFAFPLPGQIPVLMYHFIGTKESAKLNGLEVSAETFHKQMAFLKKAGYRVIPIQEYDAILSGIQKPKGREVLITFDDGNISVDEQAVPILHSFQFPATLFLISQNLPAGSNSSMKTDAARRLAQSPLVQLQAHTRTHPYLSHIPDTEVIKEIAESKTELESMLDVPIRYIAYPYGDFDQRSIDAAKQAGYRLAFTTSPKKLKKIPLGPYTRTRVKISERDSNLVFFWTKVSGIYDVFKLWRHKVNQKKNTAI